jgi:hypothetical protein
MIMVSIFSNTDYMMFNCAGFMIVVSWSSTTNNNMVICNVLFTGDTTPVLFYLDRFEYAMNFFIGIDD